MGAEIRRQVENGTCVVVLDAHDSMLRVQASTVLRLEREDERVLLQLGKWINGEAQAFPRLPGVRMKLGETSASALASLLMGKVAPFATGARVMFCAPTRENEHSTLGICTRYIRNVFSCVTWCRTRRARQISRKVQGAS